MFLEFILCDASPIAYFRFAASVYHLADTIVALCVSRIGGERHRGSSFEREVYKSNN